MNAAPDIELTRAAAAFAAGLAFDHVPNEAVARIAAAFADCVGVMLAGSTLPVTSIAAEFAGERLTGNGFLGAFSLPAAQTGLVYGAAAHALDFDDTGLNGHPSAVLVPAILSVAEHRPADGRRMIAAYLAGFEVWAELAARERDPHHEKGWHPSPVFGVVAATAAVANLRRLDAETTAAALGIAASSAAGICANFGTMMKPFQLGRAIQFAIEAVDLAAAGLTASDTAFEADLGFLRAFSPAGSVDTARLARFGEHWEFLTSGINIKLYPMCYATHRIIDATLELMATHRLAAADMVAFEAQIGPTQAAILQHHDPKTVLNAKFSAEFAVAATALRGKLGNAELTDATLADPELRRLIHATTVQVTSERDPDYPVFSPTDHVVAVLRDGRRVASQPVHRPRGHHTRFPTTEELWSKFVDCAVPALDEENARALFDRLVALDGIASVKQLYGEEKTT